MNTKLIEALGLDPRGFEPNPPKDRIDRTEANLDYVAMMCDVEIPTEEVDE